LRVQGVVERTERPGCLHARSRETVFLLPRDTADHCRATVALRGTQLEAARGLFDLPVWQDQPAQLYPRPRNRLLVSVSAPVSARSSRRHLAPWYAGEEAGRVVCAQLRRRILAHLCRRPALQDALRDVAVSIGGEWHLRRPPRAQDL